MKSAARTLSLLVSAALLWFGSANAAAQSSCPTNPLLGNASEKELPPYSWSVQAGSGNFSTGGNSGYLYLITQWGSARGSLADPANPSGFNLQNIGLQYFNGGLIPVTCDCHQGAEVFEVAEAPDGSSRMLSDFSAARQSPGSFAPGQLTRTDGSGRVNYGQQVNVSATGNDGDIALGSRLGAIYAPSTGKYFGYAPTLDGVAVIELTNTTGSTSMASALRPASILNWRSTSYAVRLKAARITVGTSELYLLAGVTDSGRTLRIGTINPSTGFVTETAAVPTTRPPHSLWIAPVDGRIFVFSAERDALRVYEYQVSGTLTPAGSIPGVDVRSSIVKGGRFPAIFALERTSSVQSFIQIYDTKWLIRGGSPTKAYSLPLAGGSEPYAENVYEAVVKTNGPAVTAYVYRLKSSGSVGEALVVAQALDISCLSADSTAPPMAHASGPGPGVLSPAIPNYFGDRARLRNESLSGAPLTQAQWDLNVASIGDTPTFQADAAFSGPLPDGNLTDLNPVYLPCDPSGSPAGNPRTGENCYASVHSPASGPDDRDAAQFRYGLQVWNANGPSASPFISEPIAYLEPKAGIVGLDGSNTLSVLRGDGTADARASQGNWADARFFWTFSTPTGPLTGADIDTLLPTVSIPSAATGFRLRVTYRGGYVAPEIAGNIVQKDLVARGSESPNPVVKNGAITVTNNMLKASAATLNSVGWAITTSPTPPASFSGQLASSFLPVGGTDTLTAPNTPDSYWVHLSYNYSVSGNARTPEVASLPLVVLDQIILTLTASPTSANVGQTITFTASGGPPSSTYGWHFGDVPPSAGFTSGPATKTHAYSSPGTFNVTTCVTSAPNACVGTPAVTSVTITGSAPPPPPPPPPPGGVSVSLSCPAQGSTGTPITCTATGSGGSGAYTYRWNWGDSFTNFENGSATQSHTYSTGGTYSVTVQATSGGQTAYATDNVTISSGAPPPSGLSVTLACPTQGSARTPITCVATASGGAGSYSYRWNWGDSFNQLESGPATHSHTYSAAGGYNVAVVVTSGSSTGTGTANVDVVQGGPPPPAATYDIPGVTPNFQGIYEVEAGRAITLHGTEADAAATFSWAVSGGATNPAGPFTNRDATFAFTSAGSRTVTLTVTGGGTVTRDVTSTQIRFSVTAPRFQALMIPGAGNIPTPDGVWTTDIAVTNPGTQPMTLTLHFEPFGTTLPSDLSQIVFNPANTEQLAAGGAWSATDVVSRRLGKSGPGVLIVKYEGNAEPVAVAAAYFTKQERSFGSSLPVFKVGPYGITQQSAELASEQTLIGLRNDTAYRFNVSLFNASGQPAVFQLTAYDEDGGAVQLRDAAGSLNLSLDVPVGAFQQTQLQAGDLGLTDPAKRYVLKASPVSSGGSLIAAASAIDLTTLDYVQVSGDTPGITAPTDSTIHYFVPGVGRIPQTNGTWKTDLNIYNSGSTPREMTFEYRYIRDGSEQRATKPFTVGAGRALHFDDLVSTMLGEADSGFSSQGLLDISYLAPSDHATSPLLVGGRIYKDFGAGGTAGMQLFAYSERESVAPGSSVVLPGAQENSHFRTNIGLFALGAQSTRVRVSAVARDGTVAGRIYDFILNDPNRTGRYVQLPMAAIPGILAEPMTIRVEVLEGSPVGVYVATVDQLSLDAVLVKGRPVPLAN